MISVEEWRAVVGFEGFYEVSSHGNVRSVDRQVNCSRGTKTRLWRGKLLNKLLGGPGYHQVSLSCYGQTYKVYIHRLVADAFIENRNETVNHIDGDKLNNKVENLEWITYSENNKHAFKLGLKFPSGGRK